MCVPILRSIGTKLTKLENMQKSCFILFIWRHVTQKRIWRQVVSSKFRDHNGHKVVSTLCRHIYMAYFEEKALEKCPHKPFIYLRYLDDIFIIWHHGRTVFSEFIDIFNSHQPPIRFKATIHEHSIDFLDTTIYKDPIYPNSLLTKVYFQANWYTSVAWQNIVSP